MGSQSHVNYRKDDEAEPPPARLYGCCCPGQWIRWISWLRLRLRAELRARIHSLRISGWIRIRRVLHRIWQPVHHHYRIQCGSQLRLWSRTRSRIWSRTWSWLRQWIRSWSWIRHRIWNRPRYWIWIRIRSWLRSWSRIWRLRCGFYRLRSCCLLICYGLNITFRFQKEKKEASMISKDAVVHLRNTDIYIESETKGDG